MTSAKNAVYVKQLDDWFRLSIFVHAKLPNQDEGTTTICRLVENIGTTQAVLLYLPLFPPKKLDCHPNIPEHSFDPIEHSTGSDNVELYQSDVVMDIESPDRATIEILYPAFVFHPSELAKPEHAWSQGVKNVFVVRFQSFLNRDGKEVTTLMHPSELHCVPTDHMLKRDFPQLALCPRCYHRNVWVGLFQIRKALVKLLNRRSGQSESQSVQSLSIGCIPTEVFNYIYCLANSKVQSLSCHFFTGSETYLDVDGKLTRRKIRMIFEKGVICFNTQEDLDMLRQFVGLPSVCGSTEIKPTLKDGPMGKELKCGHCLSIIKGCAPEDRPSKFKRTSTEQRVDLSFSPHQVRVTVGSQRYRYDTLRDGTLKVEPPTDHLKAVLHGVPYKETTKTVLNPEEAEESESGESPSHFESPKATIAQIPKQPSTFDKILAMSDTSDTSESELSDSPKTSDVSSPPTGDEASIDSMNSLIRLNVGDHMIYLGDSFCLDKTVFEVIGIFEPGHHDFPHVFRHKEDFATYLTRQEPTGECQNLLKTMEYIGKVNSNSQPTFLCRATAGTLFRRKKSSCQQPLILKECSSDLIAALKNYS